MRILKNCVQVLLVLIFLSPRSDGSEKVDQLLKLISEQPTRESMAEIGIKLRGAGRYAPGGERFLKIQSALLSIPGHAEYFSAPVWESYTAYRDPDHPRHSGSLTWFTNELRYGFQTLKHLPSPETVTVLGDMLHEEWERERNPGSSVDPAQALAKFAVTAMTHLNIRDAPSPAIRQHAAPKVLADWQGWYEKVKTGEIPFSFVGQPVEYRFQPDGSVVSTPVEIPEEEFEATGTETPETPEPKGKDPVEEQVGEDTTSDSRDFPWLWLGGAVLLFGIVIGIYRSRKP